MLIEGWAVAQTIKLVGSVTTGVLAGFGAQTLAQADLGSPEQWLAGGSLIIAAGLLMKWVLSTSKAVEEKWINEISRLEKKVEDLEEDKTALMGEVASWQRQYWELWAQYHGEART